MRSSIPLKLPALFILIVLLGSLVACSQPSQSVTSVNDRQNHDTGIPKPTPTPAPKPMLTPGTWTGTQTSNGGTPFPTQLMVDSVSGNTFTGSWGIAGPGNSVAPIQNGQINGNTITFTTPTQVANEVATYMGTISGNTITGTWSDPGGSNGTFTVTKS